MGKLILDFPVLDHVFFNILKIGCPSTVGLGEKPHDWEVSTEGGPIRGSLGGGVLVRGGLEGVFNLRQIICFLPCFYDFRTECAVLIHFFIIFALKALSNR